MISLILHLASGMKTKKILLKIKRNLNKSLIVRSSSSDEDRLNKSNAGKFLSILNVKNDNKSLIKSIDKVFKTYDKKSLDEFVIVQNLQKNYDSSGVVFSNDLENSRPYYVINDLEKKFGDTTLITSGKSFNEKKIIIFKKSKYIFKKYKNLINYLKYVEKVTGVSDLDCEFAIHKNKTIIFQIRTLYTKTKNILPKLEKIIKKETQKLIKKKIKNKNNLLLSVMSDWNPAEIIGKNSYPLSIFVYNFLVLKFNWYLQRYQNGYSKLENKNFTIKLVTLIH